MKNCMMSVFAACAAVAASTIFASPAAEPGYDTLISHRGESVDAPENTLPAYKTAVERGFGFECDIYLSKDGRVFTFHDKNLKRTTDGTNTNRCADVTWDEISRLDVGNWGKWKDSKFAGTRPALLDEVLELTHDGRWLYIDVKAKDAKIVPYVKEIFSRQTKATPANTLFLCGSVECGKEFKRLMPEYKVLACLNCCKGWKKDAPPVPVADIIATAREMGADGVDLRFIGNVTTAAYMKAIKDVGLELHVWTVDNLDDTLEAFRRGVQTVTTNCAKKQLDEYKAELLNCRPETWFHIIGGNASKAGLTADLEAIKDAGFGGITFFHGQYGKPGAWDGVGEQIPCLGEKWDGLVTCAADECARLGLIFKMQNCPGWSMSGGPWVAPSNAMRKVVYARADVASRVPCEIPVPHQYRDADSDWHDVCILAFPTPLGDSGNGGLLQPGEVETNKNARIFRFQSPVAVRTIELPSPRKMVGAWCYNPDLHITFEAKTASGWRKVCDVECPQGNWQDNVPFSLACEEETANEWRLTLSSAHDIRLPFVRLHSAARLDNWEALAAQTLRGQLKRPYPMQNPAAFVQADSVRVVAPGEALPQGPSGWTVLRIGHVNMKNRNGKAPAEATGWECDKFDRRGIEAHFAGYIGRLADGPLNGGKLGGMIVDSWECERQTWTWQMEECFRKANGYDVKTILPAIFGWVIGSSADTERSLLDWRRTISDLVTRNYYGHMAELAHGKGLSVSYEMSFGDVIPGDMLEYWKWCDTPMCEFWHPVAPGREETTFPNFKPVKPCVSAAHLYGKHRVSAEAFTSMTLSWDENFRDLKGAAVRHFARGVTHLAFHTFTHTPQTDGRVPGTSFGASIGTPFVRGQTWWGFMRPFTDWAAECCAFLERGKPVVDVLRYLGDELDHKPDELEYFPDGFKCDYLNADGLFNRLDVRDGRFVLPDGMAYAIIWVPDSVLVLPKTRKRLDELSAKGGHIVYGNANDAVAGMKPQISADDALPLWYHRMDGESDLFFVAAERNGFKGEVRFSTRHGERSLALNLAPFETRLLEFCKDSIPFVPSVSSVPFCSLADWTLSFPSGWGAPERMELGKLMPWKDLPGVSEEGRAFSGTATYTANVELKTENGECAGGQRILLDLGEVRDFARVLVNGHEVAALWAEPYRCDIAPFVRKGENEIRVEVTSTWFNRLAYDFNQPPERRKTWTVWNIARMTPPCLKSDAGLRDSGLIGPVKLLKERNDNP